MFSLQDAAMSASCIEQELQCVLHWFSTWSSMQKADFMKTLIEKAVPQKVSNLYNALEGLDMSDQPPSIFKCQLKLFKQWVDRWSDETKNDFMLQLEIRDYEFVDKFNAEVSNTSGQP